MLPMFTSLCFQILLYVRMLCISESVVRQLLLNSRMSVSNFTDKKFKFTSLGL